MSRRNVESCRRSAHPEDNAYQVGWDRSINSRDVRNEVHHRLQKHPDKHIVVLTGVHGAKDQKVRYAESNKSFLPRELFRERRFHSEDRDLEDLSGRVKALDLGRQSQQREARAAMNNPENVVIFGMCYGGDNKYFGDEIKRTKEGKPDMRYKKNKERFGY